MRRTILCLYNTFAKYIRAKLKPRVLYVDIDFSIERQTALFSRLSKKYSIYPSEACSISEISPYKYDIVLFKNYNFWPGVSCNLHFEQVILLIGCNACRISNAAIDESDENKIRSAGTLICDCPDTFDYYSKIHPRVFLCKKLELTHFEMTMFPLKTNCRSSKNFVKFFKSTIFRRSMVFYYEENPASFIFSMVKKWPMRVMNPYPNCRILKFGVCHWVGILNQGRTSLNF